MSSGPMLGLTAVPTEDLKTLLRYVHRGELSCPVTPEGLARVGLQDRSDAILRAVRGLDEAGVRAVVVAVIAEREQS